MGITRNQDLDLNGVGWRKQSRKLDRAGGPPWCVAANQIMGNRTDDASEPDSCTAK